MALTELRERFCQEYIIDLNATQAAIRAGYSPKTAYSQGQSLLKKVEIQTRIQEIKEERSRRTGISQNDVLREIAIIAFADITDYVKVVEKEAEDSQGNTVQYKTVEPILTDDLTEEQRRALAVIKEGRNGFEVKTHDKMEALRLLGVHLGMWNKKGELDNEEQRARIDKMKAETARIKGEDPDADQQDDGFLDALRGKAAEIWEDE